MIDCLVAGFRIRLYFRLELRTRVSIKMGNKQGKLEERKDSKKNKSKNDKSNEQKAQDQRESVAPSAFSRNQKPELRVYQSFSGTGNGSHGIQHRGQSPVELKFYRRSASAAPTGGRYQSLPRNVGRNTNMGRSRSVTSSLNQSRDTLNREPVTDSAPFQRHSMIPPASNFLNESIRSSSTYASYRGANGYRAVADEFPDTSAIKRRLSQFETQFAKCFVALYSHLTETVQLSAVSIALRLGPTGQHPISLYQYLTSEDIPVDLASTQLGHSPNQPQYILTIPMQLFHGVKHIRNQRSADRRQWVSLARELVTCLAVEVADELSRIFEYQIVLVGDGLPIDLLARHAVECALDFLKSGNRFLDRNTLIAGVLSGGTRNQDPHTSKIMSIVIGERELKWNLSHVFRGCGLRKEMLLFSPKPQDSSRYCPWTFFTSPECNPQLYGYRGLAVERDPVHGFYVVSHDDEVRFTQKASHNPEEIHRGYAPFRRLIGKEVMDDYCSVTKEADNVTLADYVVKLQGTEYARDTIQPIYRPLGMVSALPYRTHRASSVSSLLSSDSGNRIVGRRPESALSRVNQHYPNVKQIQVNSTVIVRNGMTGASTPIRNSITGTSTPIRNGQVYDRSQTLYAQPRMVGGRVNSDACSTASADVGYGRGTRDVPTAFGTARFRNSSTYSRPESLQPRRLYQSQRQPTTRSTSVFNPMPAHVAHEISAPTSTPTSDFIDFNSFLGMIKHADAKDGSGKVNGLASPADSVFSSRPTSPSGHSTVSKRGSVIVSQTTETWRVNGVYSADQPHYRAVERMHANNENDLRRTAISHV